MAISFEQQMHHELPKNRLFSHRQETAKVCKIGQPPDLGSTDVQTKDPMCPETVQKKTTTTDPGRDGGYTWTSNTTSTPAITLICQLR